MNVPPIHKIEITSEKLNKLDLAAKEIEVEKLQKRLQQMQRDDHDLQLKIELVSSPLQLSPMKRDNCNLRLRCILNFFIVF